MIKRILACLLLAAPACAQAQPQPPAQPQANPHAQAQPMPMPTAPAKPAAGEPASSAAYRSAMQRMMGEMNASLTGDPDQDFVAGMLPHHGGAIDMARIELQYGHDPALKKLARDIVASQSHEQVFMRGWQAHHPAAAPKP